MACTVSRRPRPRRSRRSGRVRGSGRKAFARVGYEVAERLVECLACRVREFEFATGGDERRDVAAVQFGQPFGKPAWAVLAEHRRYQGAECVAVFPGVLEVDDLGCAGEVLLGQAPDPRCHVTERDDLAGVGAAARAGLGVDQRANEVGLMGRGLAGVG